MTPPPNAHLSQLEAPGKYFVFFFRSIFFTSNSMILKLTIIFFSSAAEMDPPPSYDQVVHGSINSYKKPLAHNPDAGGPE